MGQAELTALADQRSRAVRNWLVKREVPTERVFVAASRVEQDPPKESGKSGGRAEFALK